MRPSSLPEKIVWLGLNEEQRKDLLKWNAEECADLSGADLSRANLSCANLSCADLSGADLSCADLSCADLSCADLSRADLSRANLSCANLSRANLSCANLSGANLSRANLSRANLSCAKNLLDPVEYLESNFEKTDSGLIVFKTFGYFKPSPAAWKIEPGSTVMEVVNPDRGTDCGSGVNVATLAWVKQKLLEGGQLGNRQIWKCLIEWRDLAGVIVPFGTDGKIRAGRVKLLEIVEDPEHKESGNKK